MRASPQDCNKASTKGPMQTGKQRALGFSSFPQSQGNKDFQLLAEFSGGWEGVKRAVKREENLG